MAEWHKAAIFTESEVLAHKNCEPSLEDLKPFFSSCESRDLTIGKGFVFTGDHFEVHRWHPPLVYGRRGDAETGEGICFGLAHDKAGNRVGLVITYLLPIVSARAVPQLINFVNEHGILLISWGT